MQADNMPRQCRYGTPASAGGRRAVRRLIKSGVENRPKVDQPAEQNEPEHSRENKLKDRHHEAGLEAIGRAPG